jgi:hypothetical protein
VQFREIDILLQNNQRHHRTLHIQKDVLPYALCQLMSFVSAALASKQQVIPTGPQRRSKCLLLYHSE